MKPFVLILSLVVALFRPLLIFVEVNEHVQSSYEAVAHLLVGGLFAAYLTARTCIATEPAKYGQRQLLEERYGYMLRTAFGLTAVEIVCAAVTIAIR